MPSPDKPADLETWRTCRICDHGGHHCPGCGADVPHGRLVCGECIATYNLSPNGSSGAE